MLCQCAKLTPLQARFLASVVALALLGLIYWSFSNPHFAYAAELELDGNGVSRIAGEDHNWHRIQQQQLEEDGLEADDAAGVLVIENQMLEERAIAKTTGGNNAANLDNIEPDTTTVWVFPKSQLLGPHTSKGSGLPKDVQDDSDSTEKHLDLRKRDVDVEDEFSNLETRQNGDSRRIYVSINTCVQPAYKGSGTQSVAPPQLTLYVSTSSDNTNPGPGAGGQQAVIALDEGFASYSTIATGDWYMAVHAPSRPDDFSDVWNYELAVSIDGFFHDAGDDGPNLFLVDSDSTAALLVTNNLTQAGPSQPSYHQWLALTAPYIVFASNVNFTSTMGIGRSYCGLSKNSQIVGNQADPAGDSTNVQMEMITRGIGNRPKEQFYINYINSSSNYYSWLARPGNSTASGNGVVGGGGKVWQNMTFSTKADFNCALLFNLTFCDQVAYAVPSTPEAIGNFSNFKHFYDNYTRSFYQNFNYSLQQIPCHTTSDAQYSLARNCDDCAKAYKEWLCAVSIPRCEDFSMEAPYLQPRNVGQSFFNGSVLPDHYLNQSYHPMSNAPTLQGSLAFMQTYNSSIATNQSRNREIDWFIKPGPYKEILPCEDLCYTLVQSCPAMLGFGCPFPGRGLEVGYGKRGVKNGTLTCSYLGAYVYIDGAMAVVPGLVKVLLVAFFACMVLVVL